MNPRVAVYDSHDKYCAKLTDFARAIGKPPYVEWPAVRFDFRSVRIAGRYFQRAHCCHYNLCYVFMLGDKYDETVAHECAHAFQRQLSPGCKWHGDFWLFLMRDVLGFKNHERCHRHSRKIPTALKEFLKLQRPQLLASTRALQIEMAKAGRGVCKSISLLRKESYAAANDI